MGQRHGTGTWYRDNVMVISTETWYRDMVQGHGTETWYVTDLSDELHCVTLVSFSVTWRVER